MRSKIIISAYILFLLFSAGCNKETASDPKEEPVPPPAPVNLSAQVINETEILLTWDVDEDVNGYEVFESLDDSTNYLKILTTDIPAGLVRLSRRQPASVYYYKIRSYDRNSPSEFSRTVRVSTIEIKPTTPSGLLIQVSGLSGIQLLWEDNSYNESGFEIYESINTDLNFLLSLRTGINIDSVLLESKQPLATYYYKVRAFNDFGVSEFTTAVMVSTPFHGTVAVIANGNDSLKFFNMNDPLNAVEIGSFNTPGRAEAVAAKDGYAFVTCWQSGLQVLDIRDLLSIKTVATKDIPQAYRIKIIDNLAYVTNNNLLTILDVSDPAVPEIIGIDQNDASFVEIRDGYAYVTDASSQFHILDISTPSQPSIITSFRNAGVAYQDIVTLITETGRFAYIASQSVTGSSGLHIFDISDAEDLTFKGIMPIAISNSFLETEDNLLYLTSGTHFYIISTENPLSPEIESSIELPHSVKDLTILGDYVLTAAGENGFHVVNVSNPSNPVIAASYNTQGDARSITTVLFQ